MARTSQQTMAYSGPALFSLGFRPLFLCAGLWAAIAMILWLMLLIGSIEIPTAFAPAEWHIHELLYGYVSAVAVGFLLTSTPNWTGRLPITGPPLIALTALWLLGRFAIAFSGALPPAIPAYWAAVADLAFLAIMSLVLGREIVAGRNWRNLPVVGLLGVLFAGNAAFHLEAAGASGALNGYGERIGIAAILMLIMLIGGRIVPSFTRNWLAKRGPGTLPVPMNRFDVVCLGIAAFALLAWIVAPEAALTGWACLAAGGCHAVRLARWAGWRTAAEPLVTILHLAYAFVPIGFLLLGAAILVPETVPRAAALHAWLAGAVGGMTLAVMTRASLGHSGRALAATPGITLLYGLVLLAAACRIWAGFAPGEMALLHLSGGLWIAAFLLFAIIFTPILARRRRAG